MSIEYESERGGNGSPPASHSPAMGNAHPGFKDSSLDNSTYILV